ncbi:MAG: tRNA (adenosine(37)-N6)-threonylcarbamoyltransferase complex ATPase subunit type 1 TsaE [Planctomycetota bacterium]
MALELTRTFLSRSPAATRALGEDLGRLLPAGSIVALDGELGSGKTCFVQGLAAGLGVADPVTSPTYALMQSYSGRLDLHHFDAYMEGRERALLQDGGLEWMHAGGVAAVEWARRVSDVLPLPRVWIRFEHAGEHERRLSITVEGQGAAAQRLASIVGDLQEIR